MRMRSFACFIALMVLSSVTVSGQTTAPANQSTSNLELERQAEEAETIKQLIACPVIGPVKMGDVVILGIEQGHLTLNTRLPPTGVQSRLDIPGLDGICSLTSRQAGGHGASNAPYPPDFFLLSWFRFDEANLKDSAITVEALPTSVQISWMGENDDSVSQISLVDQVSPVGPAGSPAQANIYLQVNLPGKSGEANHQIQFKARDFVTLRREHPDEVEQYMRPIFRALHADTALLPPDTILAWQVFSADARPDPNLAGKVRKLVDRMDADDYKDRDAAVKDVEKIGPAAGLELARMDRSKLSPEQASRVDGLLKEFNPVSEEAARRLGSDQAFLLNCLQDTDAFIARAALAHLQKISPGTSFDFALQGQSRRDAIEEIRKQLRQNAR
jgi:hypothetical protein